MEPKTNFLLKGNYSVACTTLTVESEKEAIDEERVVPFVKIHLHTHPFRLSFKYELSHRRGHSVQ